MGRRKKCSACGQQIPQPLTSDEIRQLRKMLEPIDFVFDPLEPRPVDEVAAAARIARRMQNPKDDLVLGIKLPSTNKNPAEAGSIEELLALKKRADDLMDEEFNR